MKEEKKITWDLHPDNIPQIEESLKKFLAGKKFSVVISGNGHHQPPRVITSLVFSEIEFHFNSEKLVTKMTFVAEEESITVEADKHNHVTLDLGPESITIVLWSRKSKKFIILAVEK